ncbi:hypothetical protein AX774_g15 [Zancudomyces culisetae]|uniref:Uncharacterized protein n=1 Tax=Zancudomyces culisetae TaxID=1213189 RepID=A0A1R1PZQ9_ZANCU|nr:hypothetical protein AX774_g15 [Zancudomyces culisetae]|eukprot:OMH86427.1 hypothetical protein AX774_g15 [Zancudomyces culisetae]
MDKEKEIENLSRALKTELVAGQRRVIRGGISNVIQGESDRANSLQIQDEGLRGNPVLSTNIDSTSTEGSLAELNCNQQDLEVGSNQNDADIAHTSTTLAEYESFIHQQNLERSKNLEKFTNKDSSLSTRIYKPINLVQQPRKDNF